MPNKDSTRPLSYQELSLFRELVIDEVHSLLVKELPNTARGVIEDYYLDAVSATDIINFIAEHRMLSNEKAQKLIAILKL